MRLALIYMNLEGINPSQWFSKEKRPFIILVSYKPISGNNDLVDHVRKIQHHTRLFLEALIPLSAQVGNADLTKDMIYFTS